MCGVFCVPQTRTQGDARTTTLTISEWRFDLTARVRTLTGTGTGTSTSRRLSLRGLLYGGGPVMQRILRATTVLRFEPLE